MMKFDEISRRFFTKLLTIGVTFAEELRMGVVKSMIVDKRFKPFFSVLQDYMSKYENCDVDGNIDCEFVGVFAGMNIFVDSFDNRGLVKCIFYSDFPEMADDNPSKQFLLDSMPGLKLLKNGKVEKQYNLKDFISLKQEDLDKWCDEHPGMSGVCLWHDDLGYLEICDSPDFLKFDDSPKTSAIELGKRYCLDKEDIFFKFFEKQKETYNI